MTHEQLPAEGCGDRVRTGIGQGKNAAVAGGVGDEDKPGGQDATQISIADVNLLFLTVGPLGGKTTLDFYLDF